MTQRYEMVLADDLDNSTGGVTRVEFSIEGEKYALDLNRRHRADLRRSLGRFIDAAKRAEKGKSPARQAPTPSGGGVAQTAERRNENAVIREWARVRHIPVPPRGRIPRSIREQYENYQQNVTVVG